MWVCAVGDRRRAVIRRGLRSRIRSVRTSATEFGGHFGPAQPPAGRTNLRCTLSTDLVMAGLVGGSSVAFPSESPRSELPRGAVEPLFGVAAVTTELAHEFVEVFFVGGFRYLR